MSDEELANISLVDIENANQADREASLTQEEETELTDEVQDTQDEVSVLDSDDDEVEQTTDDTLVDEQDSDEESQEDKPTDTGVTTSNEGEHIDYKAAYTKVLAPFKANGKTIQVDSAEDAVTLMQMGANYSQKMATLKPHLKIVKMLENNGLLDEQKLNQLIEVGKGNPNAIRKVVADNKLDAYEFNSEEDAKYTPNNYSVNDSELELDMVIKELEAEPEFNRTATIVGQQWDAASKQIILQNPSYLRTIHRDVASGKFDIVQAEVDKQRMLGKLPAELSKFEAYGTVAYQMDNQQQNQAKILAAPVPTKPKEQIRSAAKKAIAPTKKVSTDSKSNLDVLSMSDEEFEAATRKGLFKTI